MKRLLIATSMLFSSSVLAVNPVVEAVKQEAWPVYNCNIVVEGKDVKTITDNKEYNEYRMSVDSHIYISTISADSDLVLYVDRSSDDNKSFEVQALILKNNVTLVSRYYGTCQK